MRILVTGNLGYVGSHLTEILINNGHEVVGCDLSLFPDAVCGDIIKVAKQIYKDFRLLSREDLHGIDAIAHLAGLSNDPMGELNPGLTTQVNGIGTVDLAKLARESGVKIFAFASSCSIYGNTGTEPRTELDETNPLSEYASSKLFAEEGLAKLTTPDFHVYLLRNATAFGASKVFRTDLVVNDLSAGMAAFGKAEIRSDGTPWRPFINARDMARAFMMFIEEDPMQVSGSPVNVGFKAENFQIRDVGILIESCWNIGKVSLSQTATQDPRDYQVNFSLISRIFPNFRPEHPLQIGVTELRDNLISIGYSNHDFESKRYVRLNELQKNLDKLKG
jgi:nucleoside-diphosphate-sugar epimerase